MRFFACVFCVPAYKRGQSELFLHLVKMLLLNSTGVFMRGMLFPTRSFCVILIYVAVNSEQSIFRCAAPCCALFYFIKTAAANKKSAAKRRTIDLLPYEPILGHIGKVAGVNAVFAEYGGKFLGLLPGAEYAF